MIYRNITDQEFASWFNISITTENKGTINFFHLVYEYRTLNV